MANDFQPVSIDFDPGEPGSALGKGMAWPPREDPATGDFMRAEGEESIKDCLLNLITTTFGELPLLEVMGTRIERLLFSNDYEGLLELFRLEIREAVKRHEKRVTLVDTRFVVENQSRNKVGIRCRITYRVRSTGQTDNLVFPFTVNGAAE